MLCGMITSVVRPVCCGEWFGWVKKGKSCGVYVRGESLKTLVSLTAAACSLSWQTGNSLLGKNWKGDK